MIIGKGLVGSSFVGYDKDNVIFFASGVSNSLETNKDSFKRERDLLTISIQKYPTSLFIYFSSCSIYDSSKADSPYVLHKLEMEELLRTKHTNFLILRLSNAVGKGGSPTLLLNYISDAINNNQVLNIHTKATRNLIDIDDVRDITLNIIEQKLYLKRKIFNIGYPKSFDMVDILEIAEKYFNKKVVITLENKGINYDVDISLTRDYFLEKNLMDGRGYISQLFLKYY